MESLIKETFNTYASHYQISFYSNTNILYQRALVHEGTRPYLSPGKRVLDVGCGIGADFEFYREQKLIVHAIDISSEMIRFASKRAAELEFPVQLDEISFERYHPPFAFDAVICNFAVINAIKDLSWVLSKLHQCVKPDGIVAIVSLPSFHLFTALEWTLTFRWKELYGRLFKKRVVLKNGFLISYYNQNDFLTDFNLIKRIQMASILPTPDHHARFKMARIFFEFFAKWDRFFSGRLPQWCGGDHVCFILSPKRTSRNERNFSGFFRHDDGIFFSPVAQHTDFENVYRKVREKENRLLPDALVGTLPYLPSIHPHAHEWKRRVRSTHRFLHYLKRKARPLGRLTVLDVGCGNGWFLQKIGQLENVSGYGIDCHLMELQQGLRVFPSLASRLIYGDIQKVTWPEGCFDIIYFASSFHYFCDRVDLILRLMPLLKPSGEIHILDSSFYTQKTVGNAKARTVTYYHQLGVPEMASFYYHPMIEEVSCFRPKRLYAPSFWKALFRGMAICPEESPFPWFRIKA